MKKNTLLENEIKEIDLDKIKLTLDSSIKKINDLMIPVFLEISDCILLKKKDKLINEDKIVQLIKVLGDKTGLEASENEIRLNDFFENDLPLETSLALALLVIEIWKNRLKIVFPTYTFCLILSIDSDYVTLRFHRLRMKEPMWISEDLEKYNQPIGYVII